MGRQNAYAWHGRRSLRRLRAVNSSRSPPSLGPTSVSETSSSFSGRTTTCFTSFFESNRISSSLATTSARSTGGFLLQPSSGRSRPLKTDYFFDPLERLMGKDDGHGATAAGQLDRFSGFRLDQNGGKMGAGFSDGVAMGHAWNVQENVHMYKDRPPRERPLCLRAETRTPWGGGLRGPVRPKRKPERNDREKTRARTPAQRGLPRRFYGSRSRAQPVGAVSPTG